MTTNVSGGTFPLRDESMTVNRMGYGAMQLAVIQSDKIANEAGEALSLE